VAPGAAFQGHGAACAEALCSLPADKHRQKAASGLTGAVSEKSADDPFHRSGAGKAAPSGSVTHAGGAEGAGSPAEGLSFGLCRVGDQSGRFIAAGPQPGGDASSLSRICGD